MSLLDLQGFDPDVVANRGSKKSNKGVNSNVSIACLNGPSNVSLTLC